MYRFATHIYAQVLIVIFIGILLGIASPPVAIDMKFLADLFVKFIKMCIGPIVFLAVVHGIKSAGNLKTAGRVGLKAIIYFEALTIIAMLCGWAAGEFFQPGEGLNAKATDLDANLISHYAGPAQASGQTGFGTSLVNFVPGSLLEPFVRGDILQVLLIAVLAGIALLLLGEKGQKMADWLDQAMELMFAFIGLIVRLAPLAAFGAISFTIGKYGVQSLLPLMKLVAAYYAAAFLFILVVLWSILRWCGVGMIPFFRYIKDEIFIVFGTIASEAAMPRLMTKMERLGCKDDVVRIVLPTAYSFNLDGTALYLVLAPLFIAQALGMHLSWEDKLYLFAILMLTSKGAAGITGGVLVTLVSTLTAHPLVPAAGIALTLGVDRFLNEGRAVINLIGNAVATLAISHWEGALDRTQMHRILKEDIEASEEASSAKETAL